MCGKGKFKVTSRHSKTKVKVRKSTVKEEARKWQGNIRLLRKR